MGDITMRQIHKFQKNVITVLMLGAALAIVTACGGSDVSSSPVATITSVPTATQVAAQPTAKPDPTATQAPVATATQAAQPTATSAPSTESPSGGGDLAFEDPAGQFDQELLAIGKEIFEVSAGGLCCAFCHGLDGNGDGPAGIGAPPNRGLDMARFEAGLTEGSTGAMEFLQTMLTKADKQAVVEYIGWLGTQPLAAE